MAKRRHSRRKRHHRGSKILYKLISAVVASGAIVVALTLFFEVDSIQVSGVTKYDSAEVVAASGVKAGDNLFLLNKYEIKDAIKEQLPYVSSVRINRKLPDTLLIEVTDSNLGGVICVDDVYWVIGADDGRILDQRTEAGSEALIRGITPVEPKVGLPLAVPEEQERKRGQLVALLAALEEKGMLQGVGGLDFTSDSVISMEYGERFTVEFAYGADFLYKLSNLNQVIEQLEDNERGTIDLTFDGRANFIPG